MRQFGEVGRQRTIIRKNLRGNMFSWVLSECIQVYKMGCYTLESIITYHFYFWVIIFPIRLFSSLFFSPFLNSKIPTFYAFSFRLLSFSPLCRILTSQILNPPNKTSPIQFTHTHTHTHQHS